MPEPEQLIPLHGGYGELKSFRVAQLAYDVTVRFFHRYIEKGSRTHHQIREWVSGEWRVKSDSCERIVEYLGEAREQREGLVNLIKHLLR